MSRHFSAAELLAYLDQNDAVLDVEKVRAHLSACVECAGRLHEVEEDFRVLADPSNWMEVLNDEPPPRLEEFVACHRRIEAEGSRADKLVEDLLLHPLETWLEHVSRMADAPTEALVRRVVAEARARDAEEQKPKEALLLLDIAEAIVALIPDLSSPTNPMGDVWKERANVLMVLGDYPAALAALDRAQPFFATSVIAPFELAFVGWGRASVYFQMGEYTRALALVREVTPAFVQFGDELRAAQTRVLEASILCEQGSIDLAREMFLSLVPVFERYEDRVSLGRIFANIACCHLQQYRLEETEAWARRATQIYAEQGLESEITRTRWALAKVLLRRGDSDEGIEALESVAADFSEAGLDTDAADVRLDIVEECLRRGEFSRAASIARDLVQTFVRSNAQISVVRALTALREASEGLFATPALVRAVRHVLTHPSQSLAPSASQDSVG